MILIQKAHYKGVNTKHPDFVLTPQVRAPLHQESASTLQMTLMILFSLKTIESLENGLQTHSGVTPLFSMRTESQASSQH